MDKHTKILIIIVLLGTVILARGEDILDAIRYPQGIFGDRDFKFWFNAAVELYHKDWRFVFFLWFAAFCFFMAIVTGIRLLVIRNRKKKDWPLESFRGRGSGEGLIGGQNANK